MAYEVSQKPAFLSDFVNLNKDIQKRVVKAIDDLVTQAATPRGDTIKKLSHHENLWRYRIGDYRLVYAVYPNSDLVQVLGIGPRGDIYKRFDYQPDAPQYSNYAAVFEQALDPHRETPSEWVNYRKPRQEAEQETLPYLLNTELLNKWLIPSEYHQHFLNCKTVQQLENCGAPEDQILHLMECLWPATASEIVDQPNLVLQKPEDLERYAAGELMNFLLLLDSDQEKFVDWSLQGPTLVKGGPGSGKSTVAIYRVRALIESAIQQRAPGEGKVRILFTTYTNALVEYSRQLIDYLLQDGLKDQVDLEVSTLDRVAWRIVNEKDGRPKMAEDKDLANALASARAAMRPDPQSPLASTLISNAVNALRDDYLLDEFEWVIEGQGLNSLADYLKVDRTGRGYGFDARVRSVVWTLYENAQRFLKEIAATSWGTLRKRALELVRKGDWDRKWDYVIIDEAQDLTPAALALCVEMCKSPAGVFLTADASQSLYNKGFAWKNVHDSLRVVGRTRILKRNYRSTRQIATAASSILKDTGAGDDEVLDQIYVHVGPPPTIYEAENLVDQYLWLAENLRRAASELHLPESAIAVLAPSNYLAEEAAQYLSQHGLITTHLTGKQINIKLPIAKALTIHSCKGLEFPIVAVPYVEAGLLPRSLPDERADDLEKHLANERRTLFVGMTRAMRRLFVVYRRGQRSPFLNDLQGQLWDFQGYESF